MEENQMYYKNFAPVPIADLWMESYKKMTSKVFLKALINAKKDGSASWIQCIIKCPAILDEAWNKRIYSQNGHVTLAQRKTRDSYCFDSILVYLRNILWSRTYS